VFLSAAGSTDDPHFFGFRGQVCVARLVNFCCRCLAAVVGRASEGLRQLCLTQHSLSGLHLSVCAHVYQNSCFVQKYDVLGEADTNYCWYSDADLQVCYVAFRVPPSRFVRSFRGLASLPSFVRLLHSFVVRSQINGRLGRNPDDGKVCTLHSLAQQPAAYCAPPLSLLSMRCCTACFHVRSAAGI
jgi:hypothetical protein